MADNCLTVGPGTIWHVAAYFTAIWSMMGGIEVMLEPMISCVKTTRSAMISAVIITALLGCVCGTSYVPSIIVPELFREKFISLKLHLKNISRILEDAGTCLNPIWPWSMSGIFYATTFGIETVEYIPYVFFCFLNPLILILYSVTGIKVAKIIE